MKQQQLFFDDFSEKENDQNSAPTLQQKKSIKTVSLFTGCGGMDLGFLGGFKFRGNIFEKNLYEIVFANDLDIDAIETYNLNKGTYFQHEITHADIRDVDESMLADFDVLIAGFPCQPFSNAGKRQGIGDEDGRGTLWYECERIIKNSIEKNNKKPLAFVFENVRGIMSTKMPSGISVPEEIKMRMEKLGYHISMKLLRASEYGVPQNRYRFIIIGVQKTIKPFDFGSLMDVVEEYKLPNSVTDPYELYLGSVLCDIPENAPQNNLVWDYSPQGQSMIEKIGPCLAGEEALQFFLKKIPLSEMSSHVAVGKSWKNISRENLSERFRKIFDDPKRYHAPNFYRRFALGEINGTITASAQPENCGITHPFENRRFSVREIARIQSFPDDFIFTSRSKQSPYKVIGNAVPPVLAWVIAKALENHIKEYL